VQFLSPPAIAAKLKAADEDGDRLSGGHLNRPNADARALLNSKRLTTVVTSLSLIARCALRARAAL
jgi:hypothetical protein